MHIVSRSALADLDGIADYVAHESGSLSKAGLVIAMIVARFHVLSQYPGLGRDRSGDFGAGTRSHPAGDYLIVYRHADREVVILQVIHGRRDIEALRRPAEF